VLAELDQVSHRPYFTGFYFGAARGAAGQAREKQYLRSSEFVAVIGRTRKDGLSELDVRNPFELGSGIVVLPPDPGVAPYRLKDFSLFARKDGGVGQVRGVRIQDRAYIRTPVVLERGTVLRT
jgi:putative protease